MCWIGWFLILAATTTATHIGNTNSIPERLKQSGNEGRDTQRARVTLQQPSTLSFSLKHIKTTRCRVSATKKARQKTTTKFVVNEWKAFNRLCLPQPLAAILNFLSTVWECREREKKTVAKKLLVCHFVRCWRVCYFLCVWRQEKKPHNSYNNTATTNHQIIIKTRNKNR